MIVSASRHDHNVVVTMDRKVGIIGNIRNDNVEGRVRGDGIGSGCQVQNLRVWIERLGAIADLNLNRRVSVVVIMMAIMVAVILVIVVTVMMNVIIIIVKSPVTQQVIDDSRFGRRIDIWSEEMIQFRPVEIIRRH